MFAYGILLVPKDMKPGEKRPVVVCQHGLEGRPQRRRQSEGEDRITTTRSPPSSPTEGYIVYAPQNPYIGQDQFRVLQRKANPLKLSLFSFIVRQHERTLDWLATLPFVDADADRLLRPVLRRQDGHARAGHCSTRYCLSICSGDFNEWVWKNVVVDSAAATCSLGEYEMPEFDLGNIVNYAEMADLIAPAAVHGRARPRRRRRHRRMGGV